VRRVASVNTAKRWPEPCRDADVARAVHVEQTGLGRIEDDGGAGAAESPDGDQ
jgi:hypothetical protein